MVLRKPYAFLIKHFRMIHLIIGMFLLFLIYKTSQIISFFTEYYNSSEVIIEKGTANGLFGPLVYVSIAIILISTFTVLILMAVKKKTVGLYIYTIIVQIATFIVLIINYSNVSQLELSAVDVRTLKFSSDLLTIIFILQIISALLVFVRATGFNAKKFNFGEDLDELEITDRDREEFEVSYEIDYNTIKRDVRQTIQNFKYFYLENKKIINKLLLIILVVGGCLGTYFYLKNNKTYGYNTVFYYSNYQIQINDAYVTTRDYKDDVINEGKAYVLVAVETSKYTQDIITMNTASMELLVEKQKYHPITREGLFSDIGITYNNQKLLNTSKKYLLVYEIPAEYENKKMILTTYTEGESYKTKINPRKIDKKEEEKNYNLQDQIDFTGSVFEGIKLSINSFDLKETFQVDYDFKVSNTETLASREIVRPSYTGIEEKILMKLVGDIETSEDIYLNNISFGNFIENYGKIVYEKDGKSYDMKMALKSVLPKKISLKKTVYLEVIKDLESAEHIRLDFFL